MILRRKKNFCTLEQSDSAVSMGSNNSTTQTSHTKMRQIYSGDSAIVTGENTLKQTHENTTAHCIGSGSGNNNDDSENNEDIYITDDIPVKPLGRPPKGKIYEFSKGGWIDDECSDNVTTTSESNGSSLYSSNRDNVKQEGPSAKKKPRGRAPNGKVWDSVNGRWSERNFIAGKRDVWVVASSSESKKPRGRPPKGKVWDSSNRVWIDYIKKPLNDADYQEGRNYIYDAELSSLDDDNEGDNYEEENETIKNKSSILEAESVSNKSKVSLTFYYRGFLEYENIYCDGSNDM